MHALMVWVSCFLPAAPGQPASPPPASQPASRPAYYISKYSTTYHVGECSMLPKDDRQIAKPEDLRGKPPCKFCVREPAGEDGVPATQPAMTGIAKYFNLVKNEFIKEEDGAIELILPDLQQAIARMRATAAEEKKLVDQDIAELTREIQAAEVDRKAAIKQEREAKADARKHDARADSYEYRFNSSGIRTYRRHDSLQDDYADMARDRAKAQRQNANRAKGDVNAMRVDLLQLKKESATLAAVASPASRNLPPRPFWKDLPADQQEQLGRVGITQNELKDLLARTGQTEDSFVAIAKGLEKDAQSTDELVKLLRDYFEGQLGPRRPPPRKSPAQPTMLRPGRPPAPPMMPRS
jgi:hypothetical protein